jgi:hypothetical protein
MWVLDRLDPVSQQSVRWFALKLTVALSGAAVTAELAPNPAVRFFAVSQFLCFWASLLAAIFALLKRQHPQAHALNHWDEALLFAALALLAHLGARMLGG